MDIEVVKERLFQAHNDTVTIVDETYKGFKQRATFIDKDYGHWTAYVYAICRGQRHAKRAIQAQKVTLEEFKQRLYEKHGNIITIDESTWVNIGTKCTFIDVDFGLFYTTPCNVLGTIGHPDRARASKSEKTKWTLEELQQQIEKHNNYTKIVGPYINIVTKCKFFDTEFGEFEALPVNVIRGTGHIKRAVKRRNETSLRLFGTNHPMQNDSIFTKYVRSRRYHYKTTHWKTGQILDCTGTWELKTVEWMNLNKLDYLWQPKTFTLSNGKTYRPDAFIIDMNLWIDIKGYLIEGSRIKMELFKEMVPNFEIWDKKRLHELGILS